MTTSSDILDQIGKCSDALTAFDNDQAVLADARLVAEIYPLVREYFDAVSAEAGELLRCYESLSALIANMPEKKKKAVLAAIDG